MTPKIGIVLTVFILSCAQSATAQGNLVVNGGFDTNATGWTLTNGAAYWPGAGNPQNCVNLSNETPSPSNDPTASQTINSLTPVANYIVSGDYAMGKNYGGGSPSSTSFGVFIDSVVYFQTIAPGNTDWNSFSFLYTANSSSAVLSLSAQMNGTGICYFVDNVSMQRVPEPSIISIIFLGGGLLIYARARRHRSPPKGVSPEQS